MFHAVAWNVPKFIEDGTVYVSEEDVPGQFTAEAACEHAAAQWVENWRAANPELSEYSDDITVKVYGEF